MDDAFPLLIGILISTEVVRESLPSRERNRERDRHRIIPSRRITDHALRLARSCGSQTPIPITSAVDVHGYVYVYDEGTKVTVETASPAFHVDVAVDVLVNDASPPIPSHFPRVPDSPLDAEPQRPETNDIVHVHVHVHGHVKGRGGS